MKNACEGNPFVAIAAVLGGILLVTVALFLFLAKDLAGILVPLSWAFVVLGIVLGFFSYKSQKK